MVPTFIVVKANGEIWVTCDLPSAQSIGGTIHKVSAGVAKQKIATVSNATAVVPTNKSGAYSDIG
jgi:hypothetical protein